MLTTIRAPVAFYQQTKMSLMYASRAKNIRNQTHINTDSIGNSEMQQVVGQVEQLRMKLLERTGTCVVLVGMLGGNAGGNAVGNACGGVKHECKWY